ncbi:MAG: transaldolase, partial [Clostridiales bacterium]|nr:transaldolase [Clostridiales bacterium]
GAAEAATWAGVAVARKCYDILYRQRKYKKSALLQASLRGPWHIDRLLTDEDTILYFTVFPDKAEQYDSEQRDLSPQLGEEIPKEVMDILNKSEIFRKAYDENAMKPEDFDTYYPVIVTLDAFGKAYDNFVDYLR